LTAAQLAPAFLDRLAALYAIRDWDRARFRRAYIDGALASWRPGSVVREEDGALRVESPVCPLRERAARDPRVCRMCRLFHEVVARTSMPGQVRGVTFEALATRGDDNCVMTIHRVKPREGPA
jgi:hypothetical protein